MPEPEELFERALLKLRGGAPAAPTAPPVLPEPQLTTPTDAIARCRDAWQQAFDAYMEKNARKDGSLAEHNAKEEAAAAYRAAMPELAYWCGIRDFIACIAYGVLIDAIPAERTGQLLYAAQTALALLPASPSPDRRPAPHSLVLSFPRP